MSEVADPALSEDTLQEPESPKAEVESALDKVPSVESSTPKEGVANKMRSAVTPETPPSPNENGGTRAEPPKEGKSNPHSFVPVNRGRVVSLDRGRELIQVEIDESYHSSDTTTDNEGTDRKQNQTNGGSNTAANSSPDEDDDGSSGSNTSDGESSYFAKHLPSPKSGRKFSLSSTGSTRSAPARSDYLHGSSSNAQRESDASLSFSDDDEEWNESENVTPGSRRSPMLAPPGNENQEGGERWQMYPQRITRMHSVSSLVSSSSGEEGRVQQKEGGYELPVENPMALSGSAASSDESVDTSTSDPSVRSELRDVASTKRRSTSGRGSNESSDVPSGRKSPVPPPDGEVVNSVTDPAGRLFAGPPKHPQPSPPTILQGYAPVDARSLAHPQPQPLSSDQMAMWMSAGAAPPHMMPPHMVYPAKYGATMMMGPPRLGPYGPEYFSAQPGPRANFDTEISRSTVDSNTTLPLVYSEDDDTDDSARYGDNMAAGNRRRGGASMAFNRASNQDEMIEQQGEEFGNVAENDGHRPRNRRRSRNKSAKATSENDGENGPSSPGKGFRVYWRRWLMLMYMSILNLLSDWTCYSVAPISILTSQAFGNINPELLVVVFLGANAVATACEPIILSRLGLRRTVVFGALLLMMGSVVKSGGLPPILQSELVRGKDEWRIYFGFFLVGLSQPLYQCTPALLSASWFPERERTMATGVALNANQLGIGCAFIFGTLLVAESDDIPKYFGLLSIISTVTFAGCLIQFEDAPPTPPSETARIIKGTLELPFGNVSDLIWRSVRSIGDNSIRAARVASRPEDGAQPTFERENTQTRDSLDHGASTGPGANDAASEQKKSTHSSKRAGGVGGSKRRSSEGSRGSRRSSRSSSNRKSSSRSGAASSSGTSQVARPSGNGASGGASGGSSRRRSGSSSRPLPATSDNGFRAGIPTATSGPAPSLLGGADQVARDASSFDRDEPTGVYSPSPMMPGRVGQSPPSSGRRRSGSSSRLLPATSDNGFRAGISTATSGPAPSLLDGADEVARGPSSFDRDEPTGVYSPSPMMPGRVGQPPPSATDSDHMAPYYDDSFYPNEPEHRVGEDLPPQGTHFTDPHVRMPGMPMNLYWQYPGWNMYPQHQGQYYYPGDPYYYPPMYPPYYYDETSRSAWLNTGTIDDGAEPVLTLTPHHLDIDIRDDQIILSARACFSRPGFIHALVSFTVSGIVINTLSTFMDYLVRLNGAGREYVGIVGGSFQIVIMISSLIVGKQTDKTRAYYSVTVGMLVMGAFGLAECGVSLDADRGRNLRWALVVVAALVGPLQPVSTELGVDVAYPLSENTVLVIQQLFSNLLSALFIPFFKAVRDVGTEVVDASETYERPQYTFSFYLLIVLHAAATVFFATFNGRYLRYEHEQAKKMRAEQAQMGLGTAFSPVQGEYSGHEMHEDDRNVQRGERQPLISPMV